MKRLIKWILSFFQSKEEINRRLKFQLKVVSELPEVALEKVLYLEGDSNKQDYWYALLKCPCGCEDTIMLNLMTDSEPCWRVSCADNTLSIFPSIWRTKNCKSHFWLKNGEVVWAREINEKIKDKYVE